jgi:hypothetical protein
MADQDQKLCDNCHERPGTNNICYGHGGESRSLCQVCLMQDLEVGGLMQRFQEAVRAGHCKYCGAPAETSYGGSHSSVLGDHFNLVCIACFEDLTEFVRRPENASLFRPGDDLAPPTLAEIADFQKRQDEYMKQRVPQRKSKQ